MGKDWCSRRGQWTQPRLIAHYAYQLARSVAINPPICIGLIVFPRRAEAIRAVGYVYGAAIAYKYNVATGNVETDEQRSCIKRSSRTFETLHDAENALATSRAHRRSADAADAKWNQDKSEA